MGTARGSASVGGIIVPTFNPIITFIISVLLLKQVVYRKDIIGLILGFTGCVIVLKAWTLSLDQMIATGNLYFIPWRVTLKSLPVNHSTGIMVMLEKKKRQKASTDDGP